MTMRDEAACDSLLAAVTSSWLLSNGLHHCQQPAADVTSRFIVVEERLGQILSKLHV